MGSQQVIVKDTNKLTEWERRISSCRSSGMTVQDWCTANGLAIKTFYYWNNKINKLHQNINGTGNIFYEVGSGIITPTYGIAATVEFSGLKATVHNGADEATLSAMFRALKSC